MTTCNRRLIQATAALLPLFGAVNAHASDAETDADPHGIGWTASVADQFAYDDNPRLGRKRYARPNTYSSDYFNDALARVGMTAPDVPLALRASVTDDRYVRQSSLDTTVTAALLEFPFVESDACVIAPGFRREDQWYDGHYFQADDRVQARWSQDWTADATTELRPYYSELTHPTVYKSQDGYEYGLGASLDLAVHDRWLTDLQFSLGASRYDANAFYTGYHQLDAGVDMEFSLPESVHLDLAADVIPSTYNAVEPGRTRLRHDRTVTCDATASRSLGSGVTIEAMCETTRVRSTIAAYSFANVITGLGLRWKIDER